MSQELVLLGNLQRNEAMWPRWIEGGVKPDTLLEVDFFFTTDSKRAKNALVAAMKGTDNRISVQETSRGLFSKSYYIQLTLPKQTWTLEKLQQKTRELWDFGVKVSPALELDGNGAMLP